MIYILIVDVFPLGYLFPVLTPRWPRPQHSTSAFCSFVQFTPAPACPSSQRVDSLSTHYAKGTEAILRNTWFIPGLLEMMSVLLGFNLLVIMKGIPLAD